MTDLTPRHGLPYILASQAQKHVTHNEALNLLDGLVQMVLEERDATLPPVVPAAGTLFHLGVGATGDWSGQDGKLALRQEASWVFMVPHDGWLAWDKATSELVVFTSSNGWQTQNGDMQNLPGVGIGASWDNLNKLSVASGAALFSHDGGDHRTTINKASSGDDAAHVFQSNWSSRALSGLLGSDDYMIKVSPDGSVFHDAFSVDHTSGAVTFPSGVAGTGTLAGKLGGQLITIIGERKQALAPGHFLALGNGSFTTQGAAMPFAGKVVGASLSIGAGASGLTVMSVAVDGVEQTSHQISLNYPGSGLVTATADYSSAPLTVPAGAAINLYASVTSVVDSVVGSVFVILD